MRQITDALRSWNFNICTCFLLDTTFCLNADKFLAAALTTLSTMVALETPAINILTKMDLLSGPDKAIIETFLEGDIENVLSDAGINSQSHWDKKYRKLSEAIASILEDYSLVKFMPLDAEDEETVLNLLTIIDTTIQYGEDLDVKDRYPEEEDSDNE